MYECQCWTIKKAEHQRMMLLNYDVEKTLRSALDCKEVQSVHPNENKSWIFIGRTDTEAVTPILRPPDVKNWLLRRDPDAGRDGRQEEKGMTEDKMVGWHHWFDGPEFEQALGVADGQGSLASIWLQSQTQLSNWTELNTGLIPGQGTKMSL